LDTITPNSDDLAIRNYNRKKIGKLKKRRKMRRLKILFIRLKVITKLACFVLISWGILKLASLSCWYLNENIFSSYPNKYLELEGYNIISAEQLVNRLHGVTLPEKPLYLIDTSLIENKIKEMTPVKRVVIRRYWMPARLRIIVDERTPVISITPSQKVDPIAVFTLDGNEVKLLEKDYLPLPKTMETYKIITYDDYKSWKSAQIPYIRQLAFYLEKTADDKLLYLDIRNPDDVYAQMENIRLRIGGLKGKEVFKRIQKVSSVIPEAMKLKNNISYIDLRWSNVSIKLKKNK